MAPSDELQSVKPFDLSIAQPHERQVGLIGLFYCMTLFCIILGCHSFISQSAAVVLCGVVVVYIVQRLVPCHYGTIGGMLAFGTSVICLPLMLSLGDLSALSGILLCLGFPSTAYVFGAIYTEIHERDSSSLGF